MTHIIGVEHMSNPTNLELKLLKQLWRHKQLSAREIHELTQDETGWSYSTTRKTLIRLEEKGQVYIEHVHGLKTYLPTQPKLEILAGLISDFAKNVLDTDESLPAATFAKSKVVSPDEIKELRILIEKHQQDEDKP